MAAGQGSQHLQHMRRIGLVLYRQDGKRVIYLLAGGARAGGRDRFAEAHGGQHRGHALRQKASRCLISARKTNSRSGVFPARSISRLISRRLDSPKGRQSKPSSPIAAGRIASSRSRLWHCCVHEGYSFAGWKTASPNGGWRSRRGRAGLVGCYDAEH